MDAGWAGACRGPAPPLCEHSWLLLSEDVAISARDHSLGLGAGFGPWMESVDGGPAGSRGEARGGAPVGEGSRMQGSVRSPESASAKPRSVSLSSGNISTPAEEGRAAVEAEKIGRAHV